MPQMPVNLWHAIRYWSIADGADGLIAPFGWNSLEVIAGIALAESGWAVGRRSINTSEGSRGLFQFLCGLVGAVRSTYPQASADYPCSPWPDCYPGTSCWCCCGQSTPCAACPSCQVCVGCFGSECFCVLDMVNPETHLAIGALDAGLRAGRGLMRAVNDYWPSITTSDFQRIRDLIQIAGGIDGLLSGAAMTFPAPNLQMFFTAAGQGPAWEVPGGGETTVFVDVQINPALPAFPGVAAYFPAVRVEFPDDYEVTSVAPINPWGFPWWVTERSNGKLRLFFYAPEKVTLPATLSFQFSVRAPTVSQDRADLVRFACYAEDSTGDDVLTPLTVRVSPIPPGFTTLEMILTATGPSGSVTVTEGKTGTITLPPAGALDIAVNVRNSGTAVEAGGVTIYTLPHPLLFDATIGTLAPQESRTVHWFPVFPGPGVYTLQFLARGDNTVAVFVNLAVTVLVVPPPPPPPTGGGGSVLWAVGALVLAGAAVVVTGGGLAPVLIAAREKPTKPLFRPKG